MTTIKHFAAIIGTAFVLATAVTSAGAETYQNNGQRYTNQQYTNQWHMDQRAGFRHMTAGNSLYVVAYDDLRRYAARNGRNSLRGRNFLRWVQSHGRPLRARVANYQQNHAGFGWDRPRQPRWAYVNLRTGRISF